MTFDGDDGRVTPGCAVFTQDGDQIGRVKEVRGRYFKVDAPLRPDYWLSRDVVAAATPSAVTLAVGKEQLGHVKLDAPDEAVESTVEHPIVGASIAPADADHPLAGTAAPIEDGGPGRERPAGA